jgi:DNA-cytosine methyltransferase
MRHGSLFSGIGGFDLASEWMGWENVFHCEWNEFGKKVLHHYWPNAESFDDITKTDFTKYANTIDILTGGFPCQPYSQAGQRKGKEDERHLWPEMLRAIQEIKPKYIVGENVFGLLNWNGGMVFDEVHSDLESAGYEVQAVVIPAAAVNAPHGRDRVWFVATNTQFKSEGSDGGTNDETQRNIRRGNESDVFGTLRSDGITANTNCDGFIKQRGYDSRGQNDEGGNTSFEWSTNTKNIDNGDSSTNFIGESIIDGRIGKQTNVEKNEFTTSKGVCGLDKECNESKGVIKFDRCETIDSRTLVQDGCERIQSSKHRGVDKDCADISSDGTNECENDGSIINRMDGITSDTMQLRLQQCEDEGKVGGGQEEICRQRDQFTNGIETDGKVFNVTNTTSPGGGKDNGNRKSRFNDQKSTPNNWDNFPTQSPICGGDDGLPTELDGITFSKWRAESIKAYGNAIVPQVAYEIFKAIEATIQGVD